MKSLLIGLFLIGVTVGWLIRQYIRVPNKTDTTRFLKRTGSRISLYRPATLRATLYVTLSVSGVMFSVVSEWRSREEKGGVVGTRDLQLLWIAVYSSAAGAGLAYIDKSWSQLLDEREKLRKNETVPDHARTLG